MFAGKWNSMYVSMYVCIKFEHMNSSCMDLKYFEFLENFI